MNIGWAAADVTPNRPVILRGQFHTRISTRVNDPVTVTALALEGEGAQAIIMSCDRVSVPLTIIVRVRENLQQRLPGFDPLNLLASATHTHTAPEVEDDVYPAPGPGVMTPAECADQLVEGMTEAAVQAWESRAPGGVSWAYGQAVVGHNRRVTYSGGTSKMYGKTNQPDFECIEGYEDHGVDLLFTWDTNQKLTGVLINLACPSQVTEGECYVSADFWHEARQELWRRHGDGLFILPQCAAAGDQSPHLLLHQQAEALMRERRGLTEREEIGRRIANAVDEVLPLAEADIQPDVPFRHLYSVLQLPVRRVTRATYDEAARLLEEWEQKDIDPSNERDYSVKHVMLRRNRMVMSRYEAQDDKPTHGTPVHALRIGDIAMVSNPSELFLDYGHRMKARSAAVQTFVVELGETGPDTPSGYLPTQRAVLARSYGAEVVDSRVGPEGGQALVDRSLEMIAKLWE
jgi:hypothetical protein